MNHIRTPVRYWEEDLDLCDSEYEAIASDVNPLIGQELVDVLNSYDALVVALRAIYTYSIVLDGMKRPLPKPVMDEVEKALATLPPAGETT